MRSARLVRTFTLKTSPEVPSSSLITRMWSGSFGSASRIAGLASALSLSPTRLIARSWGSGSCQFLPARSVMNSFVTNVFVILSRRES